MYGFCLVATVLGVALNSKKHPPGHTACQAKRAIKSSTLRISQAGVRVQEKSDGFRRRWKPLLLAAQRAGSIDTANQTAQLVPGVVLVHPPPVNAQTPPVGGSAPC